MNRTERRAATARPKAHELILSDDELFALNCLVNLAVAGINWQGGDPDELELRFRQGKMSLKKKATAMAQAAEGPQGARTLTKQGDPATGG